MNRGSNMYINIQLLKNFVINLSMTQRMIHFVKYGYYICIRCISIFLNQCIRLHLQWISHHPMNHLRSYSKNDKHDKWHCFYPLKKMTNYKVILFRHLQ